VVAATGFGRMYVGAHLPLDLVGGAGLGLMVTSVIRGLPWLRGE
jgi:membrane-associated phospholipid phosphatase